MTEYCVLGKLSKREKELEFFLVKSKFGRQNKKIDFSLCQNLNKICNENIKN
jgi:hypothetical protein